MKNFTSTLNTILTVMVAFAIFSCSNNTEELNLESNATQVEQLAKNPNKAYTYKAKLNMLNGSGVSGMAELTLMGDQLTVSIHADGLEAGMLHPQHIHGASSNNGNSNCPPPSADTNGDGFVSVGEGVPFYGGVLQPLTPFTNAPDGMIDFEETYTVTESISPLQNRAIVLHGMTVNGTYDASLPVACGQIMPDQGLGQ